MLPGDFQLPKRTKKNLFILGVLSLGGLGGLVATVIAVTFLFTAWLGLPLPVFGFSEGPDQPIDFPHSVHVQQLGLDCTFCHRNVTKGAAATVPAAGLCITCHKTVGDGKPEVEKLRDLYEAATPIDWVRVHRVPDHVHFVHQAHVAFFSGAKMIVEKVNALGQIRLEDARKIKGDARAGETLEVVASQTCSICHGNVAGMPKVEQVRPLKMGDCVNCHRANSFVDEEGNRFFAPTDCATCHY